MLNFRKLSIRKMLKAAKIAGPALATLYPPAAPFVAAGIIAMKAARRGDPTALAKIDALKAKAASGDQDAQNRLATLQAASDVISAVNTTTSGDEIGRAKKKSRLRKMFTRKKKARKPARAPARAMQARPAQARPAPARPVPVVEPESSVEEMEPEAPEISEPVQESDPFEGVESAMPEVSGVLVDLTN